MDFTIIDPQYTEWIRDLSLRYRKSQIKAAAKVNGEMLRFYWSLGHDIALWKAETRWGSKFFKNLSADLKRVMPEATCFSETNLKYMKYYYEMFPLPSISPQVEDESTATAISPWQNMHSKVPLYQSPSLNMNCNRYIRRMWKELCPPSKKLRPL